MNKPIYADDELKYAQRIKEIIDNCLVAEDYAPSAEVVLLVMMEEALEAKEQIVKIQMKREFAEKIDALPYSGTPITFQNSEDLKTYLRANLIYGQS